MAKISLLLPTRQRRSWLARMYESAMRTADKPEEVEVVAYVDEDDGSYDGLELPRLKIVRGPRIILSEMWNACFAASGGEYLMHCGDDLVYKSQGWDTEMTSAIDAYPGKIAVVWGDDYDDGTSRHDFGTHCMIHRNWVETVGYFVPPYFVSDYNDTFFNDLGEKLHVRRYLHHVKVEHMHFTRGKAEIDRNTQERLDRHAAYKPEDIYFGPKFQAEMEQKRELLQKFIEAHR